MKRFLKSRWLVLLGVLAVTLAYVGVAGAATTTNTAYYYPYYYPQAQAVQQVVPALSVPDQVYSQNNYQYPDPWMMYGPGPYNWGQPNQNYDPNTNAQPYGSMYPGVWGNRWGWGCW